MAIDVPAVAGDFIDIDASSMRPDSSCIADKLRQLIGNRGTRTTRPTKNGRHFYLNGNKVIFWGTTLSSSACLPGGIATWPMRQVRGLTAWGFNTIRMHHFDQEPGGGNAGIIDDVNDEWWVLNGTAAGLLTNQLHLYSEAGCYWSLDLVSLLGGPALPFGGDAVIDIWQEFFPASNPDSTIVTGATNATQTFADATHFVPGMDVYFFTANVTRRILSKVGNAVTFTASVTTTTSERVTVGVGGQSDVSGFTYLIPFSTVAVTQHKAYISNLCNLSVGTYDLVDHPHLIRFNVLNENIIDTSAPGGTFKLILDAFLGYTFNINNSSHRTDYATQILAWFAGMKSWFDTTFPGHPSLAHASEFGHSVAEFDVIREDPNNEWLLDHTYAPVTVWTGPGVTLNASPPQEVYQPLPFIDLNFPAGIEAKYGSRPSSFEETGAGDANGIGAMHTCPVLVAIAFADQDMSEALQFNYMDGSYTASDVPPIGGLNQAADFLIRGSWIPATCIGYRRDLVPSASQNATNNWFQDTTPGASLVAVDTPNTIYLSGYEGATYDFQLGQSITIDEVVFGSVHSAFVCSLDVPDMPIRSARSGMIGHLTSTMRRERSYNDTYTAMTDDGTGTPGTCLAHGTATIVFYTDYPSNIKIYRVDSNGVRGSEVTPSIAGNLVTLVTEIDATNNTHLYEWEVTGIIFR